MGPKTTAGISSPPTKEPTIKLAAARLQDVPAVAYHDRVRVPGGRVGEVIGVYRREEELVLVVFASGECGELRMADVQPLSRGVR